MSLHGVASLTIYNGSLPTSQKGVAVVTSLNFGFLVGQTGETQHPPLHDLKENEFNCSHRMN